MEKYTKNIIDLDWEEMDSSELAFVSLVTAQEFSNSLRLGMKEMGLENDKIFRVMCHGELMTNNLKYEEYDFTGDHYSFLFYFFMKYQLFSHISDEVNEACYKYIDFMSTLSDKEKIITIFDRELCLPLVFQTIVDTVSFGDKIGFYKYYLENHILLDSGDHGHGEIVQKYYNREQNGDLLEKYWEMRLNLYKSLIK